MLVIIIINIHCHFLNYENNINHIKYSKLYVSNNNEVPINIKVALILYINGNKISLVSSNIFYNKLMNFCQIKFILRALTNHNRKGIYIKRIKKP